MAKKTVDTKSAGSTGTNKPVHMTESELDLVGAGTRTQGGDPQLLTVESRDTAVGTESFSLNYEEIEAIY